MSLEPDADDVEMFEDLPDEIINEAEGVKSDLLPDKSKKRYEKEYEHFCEWNVQKDPCLYILRFASKLEFGAKTQQVTNTALRLVQRMKRDSIHSGRRPSGVCGAALLIAARLHEFHRSIHDVIKVVKVHESTMRKRLVEFGDTPSSSLTLDEFMTVDLEQEHDPPSFKAARKKDKERLQKIMEEEADTFNELQKQIETQLQDTKTRVGRPKMAAPFDLEEIETEKFIHESTVGAIKEIVKYADDEQPANDGTVKELGPNIESIGLPSSLDDTSNAFEPQETEVNMELDFADIDDDELDSYIMSEPEIAVKNELWHEINADYLQKLKEKEEQLQKEREEGKPEKKPRKRQTKKHRVGPVSSVGEAIEKIIQEKKISSKINYDVLKNLKSAPATLEIKEENEATTSEFAAKRKLSSPIQEASAPKKAARSRKLVDVGLPFLDSAPSVIQADKGEVKVKLQSEPAKIDQASEEEEDEGDFYDDQDRPEESAGEIGVLEMLKQHHGDEVGGDDYGYDDYGYEEDY